MIIGEIIKSTQKEIENIKRKKEKKEIKEIEEIKENKEIKDIENYNDNIFWSTPINLNEKEMDDLINNIN